MVENTDISKLKQIRNLFFVIGAAVVGGGILCLAMLYHYGFSGEYVAKNVILSPESILKMMSKGENAKSDAVLPFGFDHMEYSYYDTSLKQYKRSRVEVGKYARFYEMIGNDSSVEMNSEIQKTLKQTNPAMLSIYVRPLNKNSFQGTPQMFNEIDFIADDFYRVSLRSQDGPEGWVYFYHPGVYKDIKELFR